MSKARLKSLTISVNPIKYKKKNKKQIEKKVFYSWKLQKRKIY